MSLASRVTLVVTAIGNYFRDSILPRLIPAGGTTGQVLTKDTNADYDVGWQDAPAGGGGGGMTKPQAAARSLGI